MRQPLACRGLRVGPSKVGDQEYGPDDCFVQVLRLKPDHPRAWYELGKAGGGEVQHKHWTPQECYQQALDHDLYNPDAWFALFGEGGGHVKEKHFTRKMCLAFWFTLDRTSKDDEVVVGGEKYSPKECLQLSCTLPSTGGFSKGGFSRRGFL